MEFPRNLTACAAEGNVLALGLGLLERTEAVLDLLLQLAESQEHGEDWKKPSEKIQGSRIWKYSI